MVKKHKKRRFWVGGNRHPDQDAFFIEALNPEIWEEGDSKNCLLYTSPSPRDRTRSRMPSSA